MNVPDKREEAVVNNGKMPIRHWIIQSAISLTMGGVVSATLAVLAIKYDIRELRIMLSNELNIHVVESKQRLDDHERRITTNEDVIDKAFPRHYSKP